MQIKRQTNKKRILASQRELGKALNYKGTNTLQNTKFGPFWHRT